MNLFQLCPLCTLVIAVLSTTGCATTSTQPPMQTVSTVDLDRYMGTWYEIARLPNRFQAHCASDVQAHYSREGDHVRVHNRCRQTDGDMEEAIGSATVVPDSGDAKLRVSFFWPFAGDYWIVALDPDYQWALVGHPNRTYGWILARQPELPQATTDAILAQAAAAGYDPADFIYTRHTGFVPSLTP